MNGYHLKRESDILPEDMQTVAKAAVRGAIGYINDNKMQELNQALAIQLGLIIDAR